MTALAYTEHVYPDRAAWLAARREGIGGSDAPAVLGLDPWTSPAKLYAIKAGLVADDTEQTEAMEMGLLLEPVIRGLYVERTGQRVIAPQPWTVRRSVAHPFMAYSPDGWVVDDAGRVGVLQCKAVNAFSGREWVEEPPLHYLVQLQHEIAVEGAAWGVLAALIGGQRFRYFPVERHDRVLANIIEREAAFMDRVARREPPDVDGSPSCAELLRRLHPVDDGQLVDLPTEALDWDREIQESAEAIRAAEARKAAAENKIKAALGDAMVGMVPGRLVSYSWRATTYKYKAAEAREEVRRVLRRKEVR